MRREMPVASGASTLALAWLVLAALALSAPAPLAAAAADEPAEYRDWLEFKEFQEFRAWKKSRRERDRAYGLILEKERRRHRVQPDRADEPPPIDQVALMARYIVNQADWTSVATISSRTDTANYPFVNIISFSDGPLGNGTGIPYMYLTPLDFTAQDIFKDNRATLMMSLAQGRYCHTKDYDPMDPRCARVVFSGKIKAVKKENPEYDTAKNAIFGRHPWLAHMPEDHHFFFAKLKLGTIALLDTFGGPKYISITDYLHPPNATLHDYASRNQPANKNENPNSLSRSKPFNY